MPVTVTVTRTIKRRTLSSDGEIALSGTYTGLAVDIQARIIDHTTLVGVTPWQTIATGLSGGVYNGILKGLPMNIKAGYDIAVQSRVASTAVLDSVTDASGAVFANLYSAWHFSQL